MYFFKSSLLATNHHENPLQPLSARQAPLPVAVFSFSWQVEKSTWWRIITSIFRWLMALTNIQLNDCTIFLFIFQLCLAVGLFKRQPEFFGLLLYKSTSRIVHLQRVGMEENTNVSVSTWGRHSMVESLGNRRWKCGVVYLDETQRSTMLVVVWGSRAVLL